MFWPIGFLAFYVAKRNEFWFQVEFERVLSTVTQSHVVFMSQRGIGWYILYVPSTNSLRLQQQIPCQLMPSDGSWGPIYVVGQNFARKYCTSSSWGVFRLGFKCLQASSDVLNGTIGHSVQIKTCWQETCAAVEWGGSTLTTTRRLIDKMTG